METFIRKRLRELDRWSADHDNHDQVVDWCKSHIREVRERAQSLGYADVVKACQQRKQKRVSFINHAREVLAACLAACPDGDTLTPPQIARLLGVKSDTVRGWIDTRKLAASNVAKSGKRWKVRRDDLDAFLAKRQPDEKPAKKRKPKLLVQRY